MRQRPGIWVGGVFGSVLAHLGFAALLLWSLRPSLVDQQPSPQSELQLQAYRVPHSDAVQQDAKGDPAAQADAQGEGVTAGAVPQSDAKGLAVKGSQVEQTQPDSTTLSASEDPAPQANPVAAKTDNLSQSVMESVKLSAAISPVTIPIVSAAVPVSQVLPAARPPPVAQTAATDQTIFIATLVPATQPIAPARPSSPLSPQQEPVPSELSEVIATPSAAPQLTPDAPPLPLSQPDSPTLSPSQDPAPQAKPIAAKMINLSKSGIESVKLSAAISPVRTSIVSVVVPVSQVLPAARPPPVALTAATVQPSVTAALVPAAQPIAPARPSSSLSPQQEPVPTELTEVIVTPNAAPQLPPDAPPLPLTQPDNTTLSSSQGPTPQAKAVAAKMNNLPQSVIEPARLSAATTPVATPVISAIVLVSQVPPAARPIPVALTAATVQPSVSAALVPSTQPIAAARFISPLSPQREPVPSELTEVIATPNTAPLLSPIAPPLPLAQPNSIPSPQQNPDAIALPEHPPAPVSAVPSYPDVPHVKAALAFSGEGSAQADPVSLTAFQSFMMLGDVVATSDPLRDDVAGILAAVPCSRLQVVFDPKTATLNLRGHLPENGLRAPVLAALQAQMGADIQVSDQMKLLPRPQCGALAGISNVGLPQSTDQITNPLLIGADTHVRVLDYADGDRMFFDLSAPDYDAYVYVDYFDAGGAVLHLSPNDVVPLTLSQAQSRLRVGAKKTGDPGLQIVVGPPYGQEIAVAFAASHPLYPGLRPFSEEATSYLIWLSERVAEARTAHPDFKGEWVYFFMSTAAR